HPARRRADLRPRVRVGARRGGALGHARRSALGRGGRRRDRGPGPVAASPAAALRRRVARHARPARAPRCTGGRAGRAPGRAPPEQGVPARQCHAAPPLARVGGARGGRGRRGQRAHSGTASAEGRMIGVIARNTVREVLRDRVWFVLLGFGFVLLAASRILTPLALGEGPRITVDLGLTAGGRRGPPLSPPLWATP